MAKFIELHGLPWERDETILMIQNVAEISRVYRGKDGKAGIILQNPLVCEKDLIYLICMVEESYEEVKRMLLGAAAQRVPWEAD